MDTRGETTRMLSAMVERRLSRSAMLWSREVVLDGGTDRMRRVDYVGFRPYRDGYRACAASLELGVFEFYEVKSCLDDLRSGHGLTFRGDRNYLVATRELADWLRDHNINPGCDAVLAPTRDGSRLVEAYKPIGGGRRDRTAAELLMCVLDGTCPHLRKEPLEP